MQAYWDKNLLDINTFPFLAINLHTLCDDIPPLVNHRIHSTNKLRKPKPVSTAWVEILSCKASTLVADTKEW